MGRFPRSYLLNKLYLTVYMKVLHFHTLPPWWTKTNQVLLYIIRIRLSTRKLTHRNYMSLELFGVLIEEFQKFVRNKSDETKPKFLFYTANYLDFFFLGIFAKKRKKYKIKKLFCNEYRISGTLRKGRMSFFSPFLSLFNFLKWDYSRVVVRPVFMLL